MRPFDTVRHLYLYYTPNAEKKQGAITIIFLRSGAIKYLQPERSTSSGCEDILTGHQRLLMYRYRIPFPSCTHFPVLWESVS